MSPEDIKTKWARAAGENKVRKPFTPKFNRRQLGAKGIGRFSISKLGSFVKVITKPVILHSLIRLPIGKYKRIPDINIFQYPCNTILY
jgi:hypothetical protein